MFHPVLPGVFDVGGWSLTSETRPAGCFYSSCSRHVAAFTAKTFGCVVAPEDGPATHPLRGLKQHHRRGGGGGGGGLKTVISWLLNIPPVKKKRKSHELGGYSLTF